MKTNEIVEGKSPATTPAGAETAAAPETGVVYDRRGIRLPAKALVGGIITPQ